MFQDHLPEAVIDGAIATTLEVADKIEEYHILGEHRIADYPVPESYTRPDNILNTLHWAGLLERLQMPVAGMR